MPSFLFSSVKSVHSETRQPTETLGGLCVGAKAIDLTAAECENKAKERKTKKRSRARWSKQFLAGVDFHKTLKSLESPLEDSKGLKKDTTLTLGNLFLFIRPLKLNLQFKSQLFS
jgi:hypothetical protein